MFGYVKPAEGDLRVREHEFYKAAYCGVCRRMKAITGRISTCSLSYDFVFLALCRMLLTDRRVKLGKCRCISHPCKGRRVLGENEALDFAARAAAVLTLAKIEDDILDERGLRRLGARVLRLFFKGGAKRARLPELGARIKEELAELHRLEEERTPSLDAPSDVFGRLLGAVFAWDLAGEEKAVYERVGYHLGRFIYGADAFDDWAEDLESGSYNPLCLLYPEGRTPETEAAVRMGLTLVLDQLGGAIEAMPFGDAIALSEIIRNTVYLGLKDRLALCGRKDEGCQGCKKSKKKKNKKQKKQKKTSVPREAEEEKKPTRCEDAPKEEEKEELA